ncbi:MAG: hypothetical protein BAJALOKI3v1_50031 [Promethearchaeota archaeon]|nr:MAG: hypothetical protein BAJALOKI3v1_50031 [Candidatus Lokiarchaeota archaeon]
MKQVKIGTAGSFKNQDGFFQKDNDPRWLSKRRDNSEFKYKNYNNHHGCLYTHQNYNKSYTNYNNNTIPNIAAAKRVNMALGLTKREIANSITYSYMTKKNFKTQEYNMVSVVKDEVWPGIKKGSHFAKITLDHNEKTVIFFRNKDGNPAILFKNAIL